MTMSGLKREIGLATAIAIVAGESIALGIFLTPAAMAKSLGSPALLLAVWLGMAVMAASGALCYAQLATLMPEAGGGYLYLRRAYGEQVGFLYAWMSVTVMDAGLAAALAVGASSYIAALVPASAEWPRISAALLLMLITAINYRGTRISGRIFGATNLLKLGIIAALVVWAFSSRAGSLNNLVPFATRRGGSEALTLALAGAFINAFFSFGGWWDVTKLAGEIREPKRNLPRALLFGIGIVTLLYAGLSAAFLYVVPLERVSSNSAFVAQFGEALFGRGGSYVLSACVLISVVGGLAALMMAAPRVYYAMAAEGNLFPQLAKLHPSYGSPTRAILLNFVCALALLGLGAFDKIISYLIFSAVLFLALTAATVFRFTEAKSAAWYPAAPVIFIGCCLLVAGMILMRDPLQAMLGCVVVATGIPVYRMFRRSPFVAPRANVAFSSSTLRHNNEN